MAACNLRDHPEDVRLFPVLSLSEQRYDGRSGTEAPGDTHKGRLSSSTTLPLSGSSRVNPRRTQVTGGGHGGRHARPRKQLATR